MEEKRYDVLALGELLIDFTENGTSAQGNPIYEANPGGAPCNVLAMLRRLGRTGAFLGKVGNDSFGRMLRETLREAGIDTAGLYLDETVHTTLAFVHTAQDGERDFAFYRNPGADMMLTEAEVREEAIAAAKIFHFGTLSMTHEGVRKATKKAIRLAKEHGLLLSFDPNLRPPLWNGEQEAREQILYGLEQCDILKISDEEVRFVSGMDDVEEGARWMHRRWPNIRLLMATLGAEGSFACCPADGETWIREKALRNPHTIETTGAGDTFCACMLNAVLEWGLEGLTEEKLHRALHFANGAASLITTRRGALRVMPSRAEIEAYLAEKN